MKSANTIKLEKAWWAKERPAKLTDKTFEKAIEDYVKADSKLKDEAGAISAFVTAIGALESAGEAVIRECQKLMKGVKDSGEKKDYENTIKVMNGPLSKAIQEAENKLSEFDSKDQEDEQSDDKLADPDAQAAYLKRIAGKLKKRTMNFAVGLPSNDPADMRMAFHLKKGGRGLGGQLKKAIGAKRFTFGKAGTEDLAKEVTGEEESGRTLVLHIEGKKIPGLAKRVKLMLRALKVAAFSRVKIVMDGKEVESADEATDDTLDDVDLDTDTDEEDVAELDEVESGLDSRRRALIERLREIEGRIAVLPPSDGSAALLKAGKALHGMLARNDPATLDRAELRLPDFDRSVAKLEQDRVRLLVQRLEKLILRIKDLSDATASRALILEAGKARELLRAGKDGVPPAADAALDRLEQALLRAENEAQRAKSGPPPKPIKADKMFASLMSVPFFQKNLVTTDNSSGIAVQVEHTNRQGQTVSEHLSKVVGNIDTHLAGKLDPVQANAMKLLAMLQTVSKEIAGDPNRGKLPVFTRKLLEYHGEDMIKALAQADPSGPSEAELRQSLRLVHALAGDDPLEPYMEKEIVTGQRKLSLGDSRKIRTEDAVGRIRGMAEKAGMKPSEMMNLLRMKQECELGSYTLAEVSKGELDDGKNFDTRHVRGELPPDTFKETLELDDKGNPVWDKGRLKLTGEAQDKLDELATLVGVWDLNDDEDDEDKPEALTPEEAKKQAERLEKRRRARRRAMESVFDEIDQKRDQIQAGLQTPDDPTYVPPVGLSDPGLTPSQQTQFNEAITEKQYRLLRKVIREELDEALPENVEEAETEVTGYFRDVLGYSEEEARHVFDKCWAYLEDSPLTITFNAENWFDTNGDPKYGKDYLSTQEVDRKQLDDSTLFEVSKSATGGDMTSGVDPQKSYPQDRGQNYMRWRQEKDERETGSEGFLPHEMARFGAVNVNFPRSEGGKTYYGSEHMVMKDDLRAYTTYCFTTSGKERRDMRMILLDILKHSQRDKYLPLLVNNALEGKKSVSMGDLDIEFHCYGPIDLTKDVEKFSVPSESTAKNETERDQIRKKREKIEKFSKKIGIEDPIEWEDLGADELYRDGNEALAAIRLELDKVDPVNDKLYFDFRLAESQFYAYRPQHVDHGKEDFGFKNKRLAVETAAKAFAVANKNNKAEKGRVRQVLSAAKAAQKDYKTRTAQVMHKVPEVWKVYDAANKILDIRKPVTTNRVFVHEVQELLDAVDAYRRLKKPAKAERVEKINAKVDEAIRHVLTQYKYSSIELPTELQGLARIYRI